MVAQIANLCYGDSVRQRRTELRNAAINFTPAITKPRRGLIITFNMNVYSKV